MATKSAEILQMIREAVTDGVPLHEIADQFADDSDVEQQHPILNDILGRLKKAASDLEYYINLPL